MDQYIFYADRIVSVDDPYTRDEFVEAHHRRVSGAEVSELLTVYESISSENQLLTGLLKRLSEQTARQSVKVVDIGVFMGSFANGISLASRATSIPVAIDAYEANPQLISALIRTSASMARKFVCAGAPSVRSAARWSSWSVRVP